MRNLLKDKNVLVTGGAGFIGSELVRQLIQANARVIVVDNLVNGKKHNLEEINSTIRLEIIDIRDKDKMQHLLQNIDILYHLACLGVRHSIHSPFENQEVNAVATLALLESARKMQVGRFVYVSSSEVYGTARYVPMTEDHPTFPHTVYGASKLAGECYSRAFHDTYQYPTVVVRPFNVFGPRCHHEGDSGEVIPKFMLRGMAEKPMVIFGDGKQRRDFTFVSDAARGILFAGINVEAIGQTINIGSEYEITIHELAKEVSGVLGQEKPLIEWEQSRPGDVLHLCADSSKAYSLLGFKTKISLRNGLVQLYNWYRSQNTILDTLLEQEKIYNWIKDEVHAN